jgi:glycosyltransferase involved in cell wall biosynthesis
MNLGERVLVHGPIPQARLACIFKQAHIFVLPSLFEGLPLVVLEALACSCRIVATDLPGVMEVLGELKTEYITLVQTPRLEKMDQPHPDDLSPFVQNLAQSIEIQMARANEYPQIDLSPVMSKLAAFTWQNVFARVQEVYFNVLEKKGKKTGLDDSSSPPSKHHC